MTTKPTPEQDFEDWFAGKLGPPTAGPSQAQAAPPAPDAPPASPEALFVAYLGAYLARDQSETATPTITINTEGETH